MRCASKPSIVQNKCEIPFHVADESQLSVWVLVWVSWTFLFQALVNQDMFHHRHQREVGVVLHHHHHDPLVQMVVESIMSFTKPLKLSGCCCKSAFNMFLCCCSSSFAWASETRSSFDLSSFWSVCLLLPQSLLNFPSPYAGLVPNCCLLAWMLQGLAW